ncbi:MAG: hypothetical protein R3F37_03745 [Candidatus Competibacteraceae bacterium]
MLSPSAGLLVSYLELRLPAPIANYLDMIANAAGPTALFTLGLSLYGHSVRTDFGEVAWLSFVKLVVNPWITWGLVLFTCVSAGAFLGGVGGTDRGDSHRRVGIRVRAAIRVYVRQSAAVVVRPRRCRC